MRTHAPEGADACLAPRVRAAFSEERSGDGRGMASGQPSHDRASFEALVARERAQRRQEPPGPLPLAPTGLPSGLPMGVPPVLPLSPLPVLPPSPLPVPLPVPPPCGETAPVTPPAPPGSASHGPVLVTASWESGPEISGPGADGVTVRGTAPEERAAASVRGPVLEASSPSLGAVPAGGTEGGLAPAGQPVPPPAPLPRGVETPADPHLAAALAQGAPAGRVFRAVCHRLAALGDDWGEGGVAIHLAPPRLGRVRVELSRGGGKTRATLVAYRPEGRAALIQGLDVLREGLARHGVLLDLEVGLPAPPGEPRPDPPPGAAPGLEAWA